VDNRKNELLINKKMLNFKKTRIEYDPNSWKAYQFVMMKIAIIAFAVGERGTLGDRISSRRAQFAVIKASISGFEEAFAPEKR